VIVGIPIRREPCVGGAVREHIVEFENCEVASVHRGYPGHVAGAVRYSILAWLKDHDRVHRGCRGDGPSVLLSARRPQLRVAGDVDVTIVRRVGGGEVDDVVVETYFGVPRAVATLVEGISGYRLAV